MKRLPQAIHLPTYAEKLLWLDTKDKPGEVSAEALVGTYGDCARPSTLVEGDFLIEQFVPRLRSTGLYRINLDKTARSAKANELDR